MKVSHLFAFAAVAGVTAEAAAQEPRVRIAAPNSYSYTIGEPEHRAVLGISTGMSGTARDTLGLLVQSVTRGSPAEKAGLEEGNRIASIGSVNLRAAAADLEDNDMSSALVRRLTRELGKHKPGDEVELRLYRDGRFQNVKIKTADSDSLFRRSDVFSTTEDARKARENRGVIGITPGSTGSRRDTLGVLVMSVVDSSPALRAGIEEGNRIAAINGVNLRVSKDDAGDRYLSSSKVQRLNRELSDVKAGDDVKLSVYSNGRFRDVTVKAVRAADLPRSGGYTIIGDGFAPMAMPALPAMPPMVMSPSMPRLAPRAGMMLRFDDDQELRATLDRTRMRLEELRPTLERSLRAIGPDVRVQVERSLREARPQLERLRVMPRVRVDVDA